LGPKDLAILSSRNFLEEEEDGFFGSLQSCVEVAGPFDCSEFHRLIRLSVTTGGENHEEKKKQFYSSESVGMEAYSLQVPFTNRRTGV